MILRPNVSLWGLKEQTVLAMFILNRIVEKSGAPELEITSCTDGKHTINSLHYKGMAFDFHCKSWGPLKGRIFEELRKSLGPHFDVLHEDVGLPNEHGHIEYDPKSIPQK